MSIDEATLDLVLDIRTPWLTDVVSVLTHAGGGIVTTAITAVVAALLLWVSRVSDRVTAAEAVLVAGAVFTAWPVMSGMKMLVGRARPAEPDRLLDLQTLSFPSGHAMISAVLATVLAVVVIRAVRPGRGRVMMLAALAVYPVLIGFTRVYLAAHWLSDVVAGWAAGALWALVWVFAWVWFRTRIPTRY